MGKRQSCLLRRLLVQRQNAQEARRRKALRFPLQGVEGSAQPMGEHVQHRNLIGPPKRQLQWVTVKITYMLIFRRKPSESSMNFKNVHKSNYMSKNFVTPKK